MDLFAEVLDRLLDDQVMRGDFKGQVGRYRDRSARSAVQKDGEPLDVKPELYMTFNAVQMLKYLNALLEKSGSTRQATFIQTLRSRADRIFKALGDAGSFVERLLISHSNCDNFIKMKKPVAFSEDDEFISYRHTIGSAIVLRLLDRQPELEKSVLKRLLESDIQNGDGGWPIANRRYDRSDILCSAHIVFYLRLVMMSGRFNSIKELLERRINQTLAFLTVEAEKNDGFWIYEHEIGSAPFSARTYPELYQPLKAHNSPLILRIPAKLASYFPIKNERDFVPENRKRTGIMNKEQFEVRAAYAFKMAVLSAPEQFLEKYVVLRHKALSDYSSCRYYETYDLCCLLAMQLDEFTSRKDPRRRRDWLYLSEPLLRELPFVGRFVKVTMETYKRFEEVGYFDWKNRKV